MLRRDMVTTSTFSDNMVRFRVAYALLFKCSSSTVLAVLGLDRGAETRKPFSSMHSVPGGI